MGSIRFFLILLLTVALDLSSPVPQIHGATESVEAQPPQGEVVRDSETTYHNKFLISGQFAMKNGGIPGRRIGTFDAAEINHAIRFLADLVTKHDLPPKILVVHRFTRGGVTNYDKIELDPRVQFVMHMDGFGAPWLKRDTY